MIESLLVQLQQYKRKYYLNRLAKGLLISGALLLTAFIGLNVLEYFGNFNTTLRALMLGGFVLLSLYTLVFLLGVPITKLFNLNNPISDEEAARQIGHFFPEISDKLLNTLQLSKLNAAENSLLQASIKQKTAELQVVPFVKAVDFGQNRKYLRYLAGPALLLLILLAFIPQLFTESTARILNYNQVYKPKAPFIFILENNKLEAYKNEDFEIKLNLDGTALPEQVYINLNGRKHKMEQQGKTGHYSYTLRHVQKPESFEFEAAGFTSGDYKLEMLARPGLLGFGVKLNYPPYVHRQAESFQNVGNFTIPAGTTVEWDFNSTATDSLLLRTDADAKTLLAENSGSERFLLRKRFLNSTGYQLLLKNKYSVNKEEIRYSIEVIPDQYPTLNVEEYKDSALFNFVVLGGNMSDDYGLTRLDLHYKINRAKGNAGSDYKSLPIKITPGQISQNYLYQWNTDSLGLKPGDVLDYYLAAWDNDGVHGPKATKSRIFRMSLPNEAEISKDIAENTEKTNKALEKSFNKAKELKKDVEKMKERLRGKRQLTFQDKKAVEELLKKQAEVQQEIKQLQQQNQQLNEKQNRFDKQSEEMAEKLKDLQKLMDELLDDETKKLYDELQRLLAEKQPNTDQLENTLEKIEKKQDNLSKELDRSLELFKKLKFEQKLEKSIAKLEQMAKDQEKLAEETAREKDAKTDKADKGDKLDKADKANKDEKGDKANKDEKGDKANKDEKGDKANKDEKGDKANKDEKGDKSEKQEELKKQQETLAKEFQDLKKEVEELKKLNEELEKKQDLDDTSPQEKGIEQDQENSQDQMEKKQFSKSSKAQKEAAQKMQRMANKMKTAQQDEEKEAAEENIEDLRNILENLITLSFSQEDLMKEFRKVNQTDPRFVTLGQTQLKLKDDAVIIEDSLQALAKRVSQIRSFVTREVTLMKDYMEESTDAIRQRRQDVAAGKQQLAMTSMNNLALLLNDALKNMQEQMQAKPGGGGEGKKKKKGKPQPQPGSLSGLQKELGKKIEQLQKSGKTGRGQSEELAQLAQQQEMLRKALQKMEDKMGKDGKKPGGAMGSGQGGLKEMMEKNEQDLVNKRITQETILRQKEIESRLLEAENAMREREMDEKRESKTAKVINHPAPPSFENYLKQKQQQVELLKTIPPTLTPFYKQETNRYFRALN